MPLNAKKPEPTEKRLKLLLFGGPGVGKTTAAISFPKSYVIDAEKGTQHYGKQLDASGSVVFASTDIDDVIAEVRALGTEKHDYRTLIIDPITTLETDLVAKAEKKFGVGDMRIWSDRDKAMRRLMNLLMSLDMNVIVTSHSKIEYGAAMVKLGTTNDSWKRLPYAFDLVIELENRGTKRVGLVRKTRLEGFPDRAEFEFSYTELARRYGLADVERPSVPVKPVAPEKLGKIRELIKVLNVEETVVDGWCRKYNVEVIEDLPDEGADKAIGVMLKKIEKLQKEAA